jgi:hypothetical protein
MQDKRSKLRHDARGSISPLVLFSDLAVAMSEGKFDKFAGIPDKGRLAADAFAQIIDLLPEDKLEDAEKILANIGGA